MTISPLNFYSGVRQLDKLVEKLRSPFGTSKQRLQSAMKALAEIKAAFDRGIADAVDLGDIPFHVVSNGCKQLQSISTFVFKPSSPFSSPSKLRVNGETELNTDELFNAIAITERSLVGNLFAAINRRMERVRVVLHKYAAGASASNLKMLQDYQKCEPTATNCITMSVEIAKTLSTLLNGIKREVCRHPELIIATFNLENFNRSWISKEDKDTFYGILHGFQDGTEGIYDIYANISEALTISQQQNDRPALELFYTPSFDAIDLACMNDDDEGKPRDSFDVLKDYEEMIIGFLGDLRDALKLEHQSPVKVLLVYHKLQTYLDSRTEYMEEEQNGFDEAKVKCELKILDRCKEVTLMRNMGSSEEKIQEAIKRLRKAEEDLVEMKEDFRELEKLGELPVYDEAIKLLNDISKLPQYAPYLNTAVFEQSVGFNMGHWLLDRITCWTIEELSDVDAAFKSYDATVRHFRDCLKKGSSDTKALISPFDKLAKIILGEDFAHDNLEAIQGDKMVMDHPYAEYVKHLTPFQQQLFDAAQMRDRNAGVRILNKLWKSMNAEGDINPDPRL